eukprot:3092669-Pleurochrysis_carterae.AAC.1
MFLCVAKRGVRQKRRTRATLPRRARGTAQNDNIGRFLKVRADLNHAYKMGQLLLLPSLPHVAQIVHSQARQSGDAQRLEGRARARAHAGVASIRRLVDVAAHTHSGQALGVGTPVAAASPRC